MTLHLSYSLIPSPPKVQTTLCSNFIYTGKKKHPQILCLPSFFAHGQNLFWHASRTGKLLDLLKNTTTAEKCSQVNNTENRVDSNFYVIFVACCWTVTTDLPDNTVIRQSISFLKQTHTCTSAYVFFRTAMVFVINCFMLEACHISGLPQSLHVNLGFVGLSKITACHFEIDYSILYNLGH